MVGQSDVLPIMMATGDEDLAMTLSAMAAQMPLESEC